VGERVDAPAREAQPAPGRPVDVESTCPLRVGSILWQPRAGLWALTVVCKATFALSPGASALAPDQDPPNEADEPWNDDPRASLRRASDLAPFKRRAEVLVVGSARAPRRQPVSSLLVRIVVGSVDKAVEVHADRAWGDGGQLREGAPFVEMPLVWERAAGGPETWNPVGMRADAPPDAYGQVPLPNLQPPGFQVTRHGEPIPPAGLGPLSTAWPARSARLGRHAAGWDHRRWNDRPMPQDIDQAFFNAAPPDQQTDDLRLGERIMLAGLHPDHPRLATSLAGVSLSAVVERAGAAPRALVLRCDTLTIDADRGVCNVVWRGQVTLAQPDERGRVVIALTRSADAAAPAPRSLATTAAPMAPGPALPFREASPWTAPMLVEAPARPPRLSLTTTTLAAEPPREAPLPFATTAEPPPPIRRAKGEVPSFVAPAEAPMARPEVLPPAAPPAPPPMIGPLATAAMVEQEAAPAQAEATPAPPIAPLPPAASEGLPLAAFPIERCAAIAASIARRRADQAKILEENELPAATWGALVKHWAGEIREETKRGKTALLGAYDRAYVARLEEERGPIRVEEYARLVVATERGNAEEALLSLTLPQGALVRVQRVWVGRMAADAALRASLREATEAARRG
jgi:hypothetical protein